MKGRRLITCQLRAVAQVSGEILLGCGGCVGLGSDEDLLTGETQVVEDEASHAVSSTRGNKIICEDLCLGWINPESRISYAGIMERLAGRGGKAVILGYTEIGLLVGPDGRRSAVFDTTKIHAEAAVDYALRQSDS
jgi:aspartate/glutamate racemase